MSKHLSYPGQTTTDYCLECCEKHGATGKTFMREAIQRCDADGCNTEGVKEKVKGVVEELMGIEKDSETSLDNQLIDGINTMARKLWKDIYASGAAIGSASKEELKDFQERLEALMLVVYKAREIMGECPNCKINVTRKGKVKVSPPPKPDLTHYGEDIHQKRMDFIEEIKASH